MKTRLLYVVVSSQNDTYMEQTMVSVVSARHHMPDCTITLLTDRLTHESLLQGSSHRGEITGMVDDIVVVDLDAHYTGWQRSRLLKTSMRLYVTGDFLFIDSDTIITAPLDEIEHLEGDICAVPDAHLPLAEHFSHKYIAEQLERVGVDASKVHWYWNSGVMLVRDNAQTQRFFERWQANYIASMEKGERQDQPSLYQTFCEMPIIAEMPALWNAQVRVAPKYLFEARILHFWAATEYQIFVPATKGFLEEIRHSGIDDRKKEMILHPLAHISDKCAVVMGEDFYFTSSDLYKNLKRLWGAPANFYTGYELLDILYRCGSNHIENYSGSGLGRRLVAFNLWLYLQESKLLGCIHAMRGKR